MAQYFFVLGKNPTLSIAEILEVLSAFHISCTVRIISQEVLTIDTEREIICADLIKTLGGTIKIGKIFNRVGLDEDELEFQKIFEADNIVKNFLTKKEGKIHFGISVYDAGTDNRYLKAITNKLKTLNITIKDNLRKEGFKAGFVRIKERYLSSVSVWKNELLTAGMEIVLILTQNQVLVGKTFAVQEFESFSFRDYGRPERDKRSGIIPPKLARMMINLASILKEGTLLDPFCGSGTILQEAIILGYKNIIGSDLSNNAISDTKKNIEWLFDHFRNINRSNYNIDIYQADVRSIAVKVKPSSIDAIVTEPYLGPPLYRRPDLSTVVKVFNEVGKLYIEAFTQFHRILKTNGRVIFLSPAFEVNGKMHFSETLDKIKELGFSRLEFFPKNLERNPVLQLTARGTIIYGGREQFVKREITSWQKL